MSLVLPVPVADVAVVCVALPDEQVVAAGAQGTVQALDVREIARDRVVARKAAGRRRRSVVLPSMASRTAMWMLRARLQLARGDQLRFRSHLTVAAQPWEPKFTSQVGATQPLADRLVGGSQLLGPLERRPRVV